MAFSYQRCLGRVRRLDQTAFSRVSVSYVLSFFSCSHVDRIVFRRAQHLHCSGHDRVGNLEVFEEDLCRVFHGKVESSAYP